MSVYEKLSTINVNDKTEQKNKLTYLSWAWAWAVAKENYPDAFYTIYENAEGMFYHTDGRTAWVKTGVTIEGLEHIEYLPVMDYNNKSIPLEKLTSTDVNKAIQRSLTKAIARHGLGLYIYAGEDLPDPSDGAGIKKAEKQPKLATESERKSFIDLCKLAERTPEEILKRTGWSEGEKMTADQHGKAMLILREILED